MQHLQQEYSNWLGTLGFSSKIVYNYPKHLQDFFTYLHTQGVSQIHTLTLKHVQAYFTYLQSRPNKRHKGRLLSASTLNDYFLAVDKFLEFLHHMGNTSAPAPTGIRMTINETERINNIEPFTITEIKALREQIPNIYPRHSFAKREATKKQLELVFTLYYGCGLRRSEGARLTLDDIDFNKRTVFVRQGKNYKDRIIPMSEGVYKSLQDYIYNFRHLQKLPHKRLFLNTTGNLSKHLRNLQTLCDNEAIKTKRLTLHILRHSIATHLLQNGMSIEQISRFLGHSSLEPTQIYTHIIDQA